MFEEKKVSHAYMRGGKEKNRSKEKVAPLAGGGNPEGHGVGKKVAVGGPPEVERREERGVAEGRTRVRGKKNRISTVRLPIRL